ncbi:MAG: hypothetical protein JO116_07975 [Planctomycetaceae bacterium]|nr:hypothetical protein [Planctomycetaceae bacterium]
MSALVADTHAVVWFLFGLSSLSTTARSALELAIRDGDPKLCSFDLSRGDRLPDREETTVGRNVRPVGPGSRRPLQRIDHPIMGDRKIQASGILTIW